MLYPGRCPHIYDSGSIESEILGVISLIDDFYKVFGFKYHVELSTRPENSMGSDEDWKGLQMH